MPKIRPTRVKLVPFLAACTRKLKEVISNKEIKGSCIQSNVHRSFVSSVFLWTIFIKNKNYIPLLGRKVRGWRSWRQHRSYRRPSSGGGSSSLEVSHTGRRHSLGGPIPLFHLLDLGILRAGDRHLMIPTPLHAGVQRGFGVTVRTVHGVIGPGRWSPAPSIFVS